MDKAKEKAMKELLKLKQVVHFEGDIGGVDVSFSTEELIKQSKLETIDKVNKFMEKHTVSTAMREYLKELQEKYLD